MNTQTQTQSQFLKGTVANVQGNGHFDGNYGRLYKYEVTITLEDGSEVTGEYSSKSDNQNKFSINNIVDFEFIDGQYPKIKPYNPQFVNNTPQNNSTPSAPVAQSEDTRQVSIELQSCLRSAALFANGGALNTDEVFKAAEEMYAWLQSKKQNKPTNDLPF